MNTQSNRRRENTSTVMPSSTFSTSPKAYNTHSNKLPSSPHQSYTQSLSSRLKSPLKYSNLENTDPQSNVFTRSPYGLGDSTSRYGRNENYNPSYIPSARDGSDRKNSMVEIYLSIYTILHLSIYIY